MSDNDRKVVANLYAWRDRSGPHSETTPVLIFVADLLALLRTLDAETARADKAEALLEKWIRKTLGVTAERDEARAALARVEAERDAARTATIDECIREITTARCDAVRVIGIQYARDILRALRDRGGAG